MPFADISKKLNDIEKQRIFTDGYRVKLTQREFLEQTTVGEMHRSKRARKKYEELFNIDFYHGQRDN